MLRAVDVPSRVVSGFKGGKLGSQTGQYEVRQLHAHLWVEAYVGGGWIPLDATPPARDESVAKLQSGPSSIVGRLREAWERTWSQGVRLSRADQDRLVYDPIRDGVRNLWDAIRDLQGAGTSVGDLLQSLGTTPERWISWRGGVVAFVILLAASAVIALIRRLWRLLMRLSGGSSQAGRTAPVVEFYERFRSAAARAGFERGGSQTPREFAGALSASLEAGGTQPQLPQFVTENYYRVRFGDERLSPELLGRLKQQLDLFERQLDTRRNRPSSNGSPAAAM
jgi:hypothetical protein